MPILHLDHTNYETYTKAEQPIVVEFSAPWCGYCRRLAPVYAAVAESYGDRVLFADINIDDEPQLAEYEQIELVPTLLVYQNGRILGTTVAPQSKAELEAFLQQSLPKRTAETEQAAHVYDMLVVGGGPAGYAAALYAARAGLETMVLEKLSAGGQMALTEQIDNYPGFEDGVGGFTLGEKMRKGAERFGVKNLFAEALSIDLSQPVKTVVTSEGTLRAKTLVLATGAGPRPLGVEHEAELTGKGVSYCANCDGMFFKGKTVVIVGGGNSAAADALQLSRVCKKVIVVHRRDTLRATKVYHAPLMQAENVEFRWNSAVTEILSDGRVTGVRVRDLVSGQEQTIDCDGLFVSIGRTPSTALVKDQLACDEAGYIVADESTRTNVPGVFAVGDVRTKVLRQVVTAVADGAVAVHYAEEYLAALEGGEA